MKLPPGTRTREGRALDGVPGASVEAWLAGAGGIGAAGSLEHAVTDTTTATHGTRHAAEVTNSRADRVN